MTVQVIVILEAKYLENAETTQFTAEAGTRVIVDKCTITNVTGASATALLHVVPSGSAAGASNAVLQTRAILPAEAYNCPEMVGQILGPGDFISGIAGTANALVIRISGRRVSN